jgi:hypothetical protein
MEDFVQKMMDDTAATLNLCYFGKIMIDEFYILNDNYFMTKDEGN